MKINKFVYTAFLSLGLVLTGCGNMETVNKSVEDKETITIYTTIYPLEDFTRKIGGDFVEVISIYPPNVDAHSYEPSTKDMIAISEADFFIYTGVGVEGFAAKATEALKNEDVQMVKAAEGINLIVSSNSDKHQHEDEDGHADHGQHKGEEGHSDSEHHENESEHAEEHEREHVESEDHNDEHSHGDLDPHVWLDPVLSIELANNIKNALINKMPSQQDLFETNFNHLKSELEKLDQEFKTTIENSKKKSLLVSHAAYGYWEKRYGIKTIAISGLSPTQEPTQKQLQAIIIESTEHNINYVIFEQNLSMKVANMIQNELGAKSLTLHNLEAVTEQDIKENNDYFSIMQKNLETIKTALND
ncbi:metal ABC transporter solute-binding protein, Zn/Mn family [Bacillus sp. MRMR6]|uniref:metal ABC transporter solute-binding protein, Zn/Mn family n=1 Tax=Bacillus sp. MRMR6 TaxID=1928617 RepID=UPI0009519313|nr:zinc ABC transporter substrate-binding protein [Bacillus sp. MRMR6]OLS37870.1 hypothetical protein BTR25_15265 [Bacillus sp. MRMR6]